MQHVAMIMDGNRRWAREKKFEAVTAGHKRGAEVVRTALEFCLKRKIKHLSLYAYSLENFHLRRGTAEQKFVFKLLTEKIKAELPDLIKQGICVRFVGDRGFFPENSQGAIEDIEEKTKHLDKLYLHILFCYGSQQELVVAAKRVAQKVQSGELLLDHIDEDTIRQETWLGNVPDPDVIIRTGKHSRLSNFLLFQAAYSELVFLDCYWPEVTEEILESCFEKFSKEERKFGR